MKYKNKWRKRDETKEPIKIKEQPSARPDSTEEQLQSAVGVTTAYGREAFL